MGFLLLVAMGVGAVVLRKRVTGCVDAAAERIFSVKSKRRAKGALSPLFRLHLMGLVALVRATTADVTASNFIPYYTYKGGLAVAGDVGPVSTAGTSQTFGYYFTGVDPGASPTWNNVPSTATTAATAHTACSKLNQRRRTLPACAACVSGPDTGIANSCGIHIHTGTTCTGDAGGHLWKATATVTSDPWASVSYTATASGVASGAASGLDTGLAASDLPGKAFIVHDRSGARIACAVMGEGDGALHPLGAVNGR